MNRHENLRIIAFVGPGKSGKTTAVAYLASQHYPKITADEHDTAEVINEVHHLANAGQHRIIIDGLQSKESVASLRHEFPTEVTIIAIARPGLPELPDTQAALTIENDGDITALHQRLDQLIEALDFHLS